MMMISLTKPIKKFQLEECQASKARAAS